MTRSDVLEFSTADRLSTKLCVLGSAQAFATEPSEPCTPVGTDDSPASDRGFLSACGPGGHSGNSSSKTGGKLKVLVVEDEPADIELVLHALRQAGFEVVADIAQSAEEFDQRVHRESYDVILADYKLPHWTGMESVEALRRLGLDIPVILVSGSLGELTAVECIKQGAADYVLKDDLARLPEAVRRAMREKRLREQNDQGQQELAPLQP